jgi:hypothetical protein
LAIGGGDGGGGDGRRRDERRGDELVVEARDELEQLGQEEPRVALHHLQHEVFVAHLAGHLYGRITVVVLLQTRNASAEQQSLCACRAIDVSLYRSCAVVRVRC